MMTTGFVQSTPMAHVLALPLRMAMPLQADAGLLGVDVDVGRSAGGRSGGIDVGVSVGRRGDDDREVDLDASVGGRAGSDGGGVNVGASVGGGGGVNVDASAGGRDDSCGPSIDASVGGSTGGSGGSSGRGSGGEAGGPGDGGGSLVAQGSQSDGRMMLPNGQPSAVLIGLMVCSSDRVTLGVVQDVVSFDGTTLRLRLAANSSLGLDRASVALDVPLSRLTSRSLVLSMTASDFMTIVSA